MGLLPIAACGASPALHPTPGVAGMSGGTGGDSGGTDAVTTAGNTGAAGAIDAAGATGSADATGTAGITTDAATVSQPREPGKDAATDATADLPMPPHDYVSVINSGNWNESTMYPFNKRRMLVRDEGNPQVVLLDFSRPDPVVWRTVAGGPWARALQLIGNNQVMGGRADGYEVFDLTTGAIVKAVRTFPNTQSAYRMGMKARPCSP